MKITHEFLQEASTTPKTLAFNTQQFQLLGVIGPDQRFNDVPSGWVRDLIGSEITDEAANELLEIGKARRKAKGRTKPAPVSKRPQEITRFRMRVWGDG